MALSMKIISVVRMRLTMILMDIQIVLTLIVMDMGDVLTDDEGDDLVLREHTILTQMEILGVLLHQVFNRVVILCFLFHHEQME